MTSQKEATSTHVLAVLGWEIKSLGDTLDISSPDQLQKYSFQSLLY